MGHSKPGFSLSLQQLECRDLPSSVIVNQSFETISTQELHDDWIIRSNQSNGRFLVSGLTAATGQRSLASTGSLSTSSFALYHEPVVGNVAVSLKIQGSGPAPIDVLARATEDGGSYLAARLNPSKNTLELIDVRHSASDVLANVKLQQPIYGSWYNVKLSLNGRDVSIEVTREDTHQYLNADGNWQTTPISAIGVEIEPTATSGYVGMGRGLGGYGLAFVDDFKVEKTSESKPAISSEFRRIAYVA